MWDCTISWGEYVRYIPTTDLIQITRCSYYHLDIKELKSRVIPEELKLEVLLITGDCDD